MHIFHYLAGFWFYGTQSYCFQTSSYFGSEKMISGLLLTVMWFQNSVMRTFAKMRSENKNRVHSMPTSWEFELVSSPHYFAEIIIYALLSLHALSLLSFSLFLFV